MAQTVGVLAERLGCRVQGDPSIIIEKVASIASASSGSLVFVENLKNLQEALKSSAAAVIAGEFAAHDADAKTILISTQPRLAFARAARLLREAVTKGRTVHPSAVVPESVRLGRNVAIGSRVVVGED